MATRNVTSSETERPAVTTTNRAREGVTGHGVRYVLTISTVAIVVAFAVLWFFYFGR